MVLFDCTCAAELFGQLVEAFLVGFPRHTVYISVHS